MRPVGLTVVVALLLVTAGCSYSDAETDEAGGLNTDVPDATTDATSATTTRTGETENDERSGVPPDPATDTLGWENGVWYNESIAVSVENGLNDTEREALLDRTMARVERIRGLEFDRDITLAFETREETVDDRTRPRIEQVYEALFLVGENTTYGEAVRDSGLSTAGYYSGDRVILFVNETPPETVDPGLLAHEVTHALQDQRLGNVYTSRDLSLDEARAYAAPIEGGATGVEQRYLERCAGEWDCLPVPPEDRPDRNDPRQFGLVLTLLSQYNEGRSFVAALRDRSDGEWTAVNDAWDDRPESTEQVIHPEKYPDEEPVAVDLEDRSAPD